MLSHQLFRFLHHSSYISLSIMDFYILPIFYFGGFYIFSLYWFCSQVVQVLTCACPLDHQVMLRLGLRKMNLFPARPGTGRSASPSRGGVSNPGVEIPHDRCGAVRPKADSAENRAVHSLSRKEKALVIYSRFLLPTFRLRYVEWRTQYCRTRIIGLLKMAILKR